MLFVGADVRPRMDHGIFGNNDDTILDDPTAFVNFGAAWEGLYNHPFADMHIFIQDSAIDLAALA